MSAAASGIIAACRHLAATGLMPGRSGNISVRSGDHMRITPSGLPPAQMAEACLVTTRFDGSFDGAMKPSSEWRMHADIYRLHAAAGAVVHLHSPYATAYSCHRRDLPAFHYMVAVAGGDTIRCADYALFGTQALSDAMLAALEGRRACLLANHGQIAFGETLDKAVELAEEVETLCRQYTLAQAFGAPVILGSAEMADVTTAFAGYGQRGTT
jgi:L-fuculose-phosphate aldolase